MDYSMLVGIEEERHELVIGIIDFMRPYTWDKQLETWVKASGILGGPRNAAPTIISPDSYKIRFRKAMKTYFVVVPDDLWTPPPAVSSMGTANVLSTHASAVVKREDTNASEDRTSERKEDANR